MRPALQWGSMEPECRSCRFPLKSSLHRLLCWLCIPLINRWFRSQSQNLRPTFRQLILVPGLPSSSVTNFSFSLKFSSDGCGFVINLRRPLWRVDWSVIYCCCWASSAQLFSCLIPTDLKTKSYYPSVWESPNLDDQVPVIIYSRSRVAQLYPQDLGSRGLVSLVFRTILHFVTLRRSKWKSQFPLLLSGLTLEIYSTSRCVVTNICRVLLLWVVHTE
jgi:hypothetical protein